MLLDKTCVAHCKVHGVLGRLADRGQRQAHFIGAKFEPVRHILGRSGIGLHEQVLVEEGQLVVDVTGASKIAGQRQFLHLGAEARGHVRRHRNAAMAAMRIKAKSGAVIALKQDKILAELNALHGGALEIAGGILDAEDV